MFKNSRNAVRSSDIERRALFSLLTLSLCSSCAALDIALHVPIMRCMRTCSILTVNMIDVVCAHVLVVGLLPTEWKLIADAVCEGLGFGKSAERENFLFTFALALYHYYLSYKCVTQLFATYI